MIDVIQHENEYRVSFPYDVKVKDLVKAVPGRQWHPDIKCWTIPSNHLGMLIAQFKGTEYEDSVRIRSLEEINVNQTLDPTTAIPNIDLSSTKLYVRSGFKLYDHQKDFLRFSIDRQNRGNMNGFLVCDTMGLGKTLESLNLALYNKAHNNFQHCLVLCCINMSKYNWADEIYTQTNHEFEGYILGARKGKRANKISYNGPTKNKLEDLLTGHMYGDEAEPELPYFLIMNIESIRYKDKKTRKYTIADTIIDYINSGKINMVIVDEVHKNVSPQSQQGKQLLRIKKATENRCMWLPMTGTPIVNQPTDLFLPLRLIEAHSINSYWTWNQFYCVFGGFGGHEIVGYRNMQQLKTLLQGNMIRRLKEDVLDLPEKIELVEYVENTQIQKKLEKIVNNEIWEDREAVVADLNPMTRLLRLRQVNGSPELVDFDIVVDKTYLSKNAKLQRLLELLAEITARGEKVVVFSNWVEPLRVIYRHIAHTYTVACFTGTMKEADRQAHKAAFQNDPNCKIIIGTIGALGTTHTLTAANNVIFYDESWTAADRNQALDRVHRIGTTKSVNIYTLISKDTVDEVVHNILYGKETVAGFMVDNKLDIYNNPDLLRTLLGR